MKTGFQYRGRSLLIWLVSVSLLIVMTISACGSEPQAVEERPDPNEEVAPSFELPAAQGGMKSLSQLLEGRDAVALVFYRGFF